jgi:hypothetical protein
LSDDIESWSDYIEKGINEKCDNCGCKEHLIAIYIDTKGLDLEDIMDLEEEGQLYLCESCHADLRGPDLSKWWQLK